MPIIKVWCLPLGQSEDDLNRLHRRIVQSVVSVSELGLRDEKDITCLFPSDLMKYGLREDVIIEIGGLFEKPERTQEVRQRLAKKVGEGVKELFPAAKVECFISTTNPANGFWTSDSPVSQNTVECPVHGSIEHMQSATGRCPSCGKP